MNLSNSAISQRDCENYYQFMNSNADQIVEDLIEFFKKHIQDQFFSADFVVDIYRKESVSIVDLHHSIQCSIYFLG